MKTRIGLQEIEAIVSNIFITASACRWTHSRLVDELGTKVWTPLNQRFPNGKRKFSQYLCGYASGLVHAYTDAIWRNDVEFVYRSTDGALFSTSKNSTHRSTEEFYSAGRGCELGNMDCAHVWRGTDKPFTEFKKAGA